MRLKQLFAVFFVFALVFAACQPISSTDPGDTAGNTDAIPPFTIGAIPDQDPELLQRLYGLLADYLSQEVGVPVEYKPVTDYTAAVTAFRVGDLDMVWFGGLTGVQARLQVSDAQAIVQRSLDEEFHSVFIANVSSGLQPFTELTDLAQLKGNSFTFGSESSTSGRLMPQYFLNQAGVALTDFQGEPGFSGSHDTTVDLVESGAYAAGALNEQVWLRRVADRTVDLNKVVVLWTTPPYHDYHWVVRPDVTARYGEDFVERVVQAFLRLDINTPADKEILDLFGAEKFITTTNENYLQIEAIGREIGRIQD